MSENNNKSRFAVFNETEMLELAKKQHAKKTVMLIVVIIIVLVGSCLMLKMFIIIIPKIICLYFVFADTTVTTPTGYETTANIKQIFYYSFIS